MISRKRVIHLLGTLLSLAALVYFGRSLAAYWPQTLDLLQRPSALWGVVLATTLLMAGYLVSAISWRQICRALGLQIPFSSAVRIYFVSQFGKYLPGNVAQHAGRLALGMREGMSGTALATSQLVEIVLVVATSGALVLLSGAASLTAWQPGLPHLSPLKISLALLVLLVILAAVWLVLRSSRFRARIQHAISLAHALVTTRHGISHLSTAALLSLLNIIITSGALHLVIVTIVGAHLAPSFGTTCSVYIVTWLAGFVTPGSPAGVGIREVMMLKLLSQSIPIPDAAAISLAFRISTTLNDLLIFFAGYYIPRRSNSLEREEPPTS